MEGTTEGQPARRRAARLAAVAGLLVIGLSGCDSEPQFDPEQERNIRPGQLPEGTPRDEEN
jgi:hypothetical protein